MTGFWRMIWFKYSTPPSRTSFSLRVSTMLRFKYIRRFFSMTDVAYLRCFDLSF